MERGLLQIKTALVSVSDKGDLLGLCRLLHRQGCRIIASKGTAKILAEADIPVGAVEELSGTPEAFHGRMKTLSFNLCSGILFRRDDPRDCSEAQELGLTSIDLVVGNLYPFHRKPVEQLAADEVVELIDIGGPTLLRSAAKNYRHVAVLSDPSDYQEFMDALIKHGGSIPLALREKNAARTFLYTAHYESKIAEEFSRRFKIGTADPLHRSRLQRKELRYGENPQQLGYVLIDREAQGIASAAKLQGKALSYNNYLDGDAALRCTSDLLHYVSAEDVLPLHSVTIVKHQNPCGAGTSIHQLDALQMAWAADSKSAFGSVLCFSHLLELDAAEWLKDKFIEVIIAPSFSEQALNIFAGKSNLRLLQSPLLPNGPGEEMWRSISGGFLVQEEDWEFSPELLRVTTSEFPLGLFPLVKFGMVLSKHLKSNSVVLVEQSGLKEFSVLGTGMGQPNRIDSLLRLALPRSFTEATSIAREQVVMVSDGFFPFPDIVQEAAMHGIKYLVQPGGSIRDEEVIAACDRSGLSMLFTGRRHFRH